MNLLAWNVRGLANPCTFNALHFFVKNHVPSVLFLSETKLTKQQGETLRLKLGYACHICVPRRGLGGGLSLLWNKNVAVTLLLFHVSFIHCWVELVDRPGEGFFFTGFYGNPDATKRHLSWELLCNLKPTTSSSWLVGGDFNEILWNDEYLGALRPNRRLIQDFAETLSECDLYDMGFQGYKYTWNNGRENERNVQKRLDRFVCNENFQRQFLVGTVRHISNTVSDHSCLLLQLQSKSHSPSTTTRSFKFAAQWIRDGECQEVIRSVWERNPINLSADELTSSISTMGKALQGWSKQKGIFSKNFKKFLCDKLETLAAAPPSLDNLKRKKDVQNQFNEVLIDEEIKWKQLSREKWLKEGDRNTSFFHKKASEKRRRNMIIGIETGLGGWTEDKHQIQNVFIDYFSQIFSSQGTNLAPIVDSVTQRLSSDMQSRLSRVYTVEEVRTALFSMDPNTAPGPDGMSPLFYQQYWGIVGPGLSQAILNFLNHDLDISALNRTSIALIPKVEKPVKVAEFRPISLCNVCYKIISKVLANRLKEVLDSVIDDSQSAFIPGRLISDNVIVSFEVMHTIKKSQSKKGLFSLKLDMSKAYDRVEWDFLEAMMIRLGFPDPFVTRIMKCVRSVHFTVNINGEQVGNIVPTRGIRQGDPISPYLFLICSEGLTSLLRKAKVEGKLKGVKPGRNSPPITHLLFADDSVFFGKANHSEATVIKQILYDYERASGQCVNFEKSALCFSPKTPQSTKEEFAAVLGINTVDGHSKYLGLPTCVARNKGELFAFVNERVEKRLMGYSEKFLSTAGREVMIKAVAQAIPTYVMSCFLIPTTNCMDMQKAVTRFWWGGNGKKRKMHWCSWEKLCTNKVQGGMGFRCFESFNLALLAKQGWRVMCNPQSLMARVLKGKYFCDKEFLQAELGSQPSYLWRSILLGRQVLYQGLRHAIGDGQSTLIYQHRWLPLGGGKKVYSFPYLGSEARVCDLLGDDGNWNKEKIQQNFSEDEASAISEIPLRRVKKADKLAWGFTKDGSYSVSSGYQVAFNLHFPTLLSEVSEGGSDPNAQNFFKVLWSLNIPGKVRIFGWKLWKGFLPVRANLAKRGMSVPVHCSFCNREKEEIQHLFFSCKHVCKIWLESGLQEESVATSGNHLQQATLLDLPVTSLRKFFLIAWILWNRRNQLVIEGKSPNLETIISEADRYIRDWDLALISETQRNTPSVDHQRRWQPPPVEFLKLNSDVAVDRTQGMAWAGGVVRNHLGEFIAGRFAPVEICSSSTDCEVMALLSNLRWLLSFSSMPFQIEVDATNLELGLKKNHTGFNESSWLMEELRELLGDRVQMVMAVKRRFNGAAHSMAQKGLLEKTVKIYVGQPPPFLVPSLDFDLHGPDQATGP